MRCGTCNAAMAYTGVMCLCGHKQYVCPKCKHIWSYNHKTPGIYQIDWDAEHKMKEFVKSNQEKMNIKSYEEYIAKMVVEWKKNSKFHQ